MRPILSQLLRRSLLVHRFSLLARAEAVTSWRPHSSVGIVTSVSASCNLVVTEATWRPWSAARSVTPVCVTASAMGAVYPPQHSHRSMHTSRLSAGKLVPFLLSDIGEGIVEVVVKEWYVQEGESVNQFDNLCEVQSDKASVTITSRYDGVIRRRYYAVDEMALVGKPLVDIETETSSSDSEDEVQERDAIEVVGGDHFSFPTSHKLLTTPAVRRIAMENSVTLSDVRGTGKDGRILKEDLARYLEEKNVVKALPTKPEIASPPPFKSTPTPTQPAVPVIETAKLPTAANFPETTTMTENKTVPVSGFIKAMGKSMKLSMTVPHFGYCDEFDMTALVRLMPSLKQYVQQFGIKLSYMPLIIKACSMALLHFPVLNASVDDACEHLTYKANHNIGIAMDTPNGLVVPNVKAVQQLSVLEVAGELQRLQAQGARGQLSTAHLSGGTFSLSNIGAIGGTYAKPVIVPPEVAIGAIGRIQKLPRFGDDGSVMAAHMMQMSWSADHRVIDGATMARFSNMMKALLQEPAVMLIQMK